MDEVTTGSLLKRVFMFLEDGNWQSADEYCERILDMEPENPRAYLGKLLAEMRAHTLEELGAANRSFENSPNYKKLIRFGDADLTGAVTAHLDAAKENSRTASGKRGIKHLKVVYSQEEALTPTGWEEEAAALGKRQIPGSVSFVPGAAGLILAGEVIKDIATER